MSMVKTTSASTSTSLLLVSMPVRIPMSVSLPLPIPVVGPGPGPGLGARSGSASGSALDADADARSAVIVDGVALSMSLDRYKNRGREGERGFQVVDLVRVRADSYEESGEDEDEDEDEPERQPEGYEDGVAEDGLASSSSSSSFSERSRYSGESGGEGEGGAFSAFPFPFPAPPPFPFPFLPPSPSPVDVDVELGLGVDSNAGEGMGMEAVDLGLGLELTASLASESPGPPPTRKGSEVEGRREECRSTSSSSSSSSRSSDYGREFGIDWSGRGDADDASSSAPSTPWDGDGEGSVMCKGDESDLVPAHGGGFDEHHDLNRDDFHGDDKNGLGGVLDRDIHDIDDDQEEQDSEYLDVRLAAELFDKIVNPSSNSSLNTSAARAHAAASAFTGIPSTCTSISNGTSTHSSTGASRVRRQGMCPPAPSFGGSGPVPGAPGYSSFGSGSRSPNSPMCTSMSTSTDLPLPPPPPPPLPSLPLPLPLPLPLESRQRNGDCGQWALETDNGEGSVKQDYSLLISRSKSKTRSRKEFVDYKKELLDTVMAIENSFMEPVRRASSSVSVSCSGSGSGSGTANSLDYSLGSSRSIGILASLSSTSPAPAPGQVPHRTRLPLRPSLKRRPSAFIMPQHTSAGNGLFEDSSGTGVKAPKLPLNPPPMLVSSSAEPRAGPVQIQPNFPITVNQNRRSMVSHASVRPSPSHCLRKTSSGSFKTALSLGVGGVAKLRGHDGEMSVRRLAVPPVPPLPVMLTLSGSTQRRYTARSESETMEEATSSDGSVLGPVAKATTAVGTTSGRIVPSNVTGAMDPSSKSGASARSGILKTNYGVPNPDARRCFLPPDTKLSRLRPEVTTKFRSRMQISAVGASCELQAELLSEGVEIQKESETRRRGTGFGLGLGLSVLERSFLPLPTVPSVRLSSGLSGAGRVGDRAQSLRDKLGVVDAEIEIESAGAEGGECIQGGQEERKKEDAEERGLTRLLAPNSPVYVENGSREASSSSSLVLPFHEMKVLSQLPMCEVGVPDRVKSRALDGDDTLAGDLDQDAITNGDFDKNANVDSSSPPPRQLQRAIDVKLTREHIVLRRKMQGEKTRLAVVPGIVVGQRF